MPLILIESFSLDVESPKTTLESAPFLPVDGYAEVKKTYNADAQDAEPGQDFDAEEERQSHAYILHSNSLHSPSGPPLTVRTGMMPSSLQTLSLTSSGHSHGDLRMYLRKVP